jgi:hypothetical protein
MPKPGPTFGTQACFCRESYRNLNKTQKWNHVYVPILGLRPCFPEVATILFLFDRAIREFFIPEGGFPFRQSQQMYEGVHCTCPASALGSVYVVVTKEILHNTKQRRRSTQTRFVRLVCNTGFQLALLMVCRRGVRCVGYVILCSTRLWKPPTQFVV